MGTKTDIFGFQIIHSGQNQLSIFKLLQPLQSKITTQKILIIFALFFSGQLYSQNRAKVDDLLQKISAKYDNSSLFRTTEAKESIYIDSFNRQHRVAEISTSNIINEILDKSSKDSEPQIIALVELKIFNQFTASKNIRVNSKLGKFITVEFNISHLSELVNNGEIKPIVFFIACNNSE